MAVLILIAPPEFLILSLDWEKMAPTGAAGFYWFQGQFSRLAMAPSKLP